MHVYDLACHRLRALFPTSSVVRELDRKIALVAAAERAAKLSHCARRACPFPTVKDTGLCRGHLADSMAQLSYLPSSLGVATIPVAAPRSRAAAHA